MGVGTHWIKWSLVGRPFDPAAPSMLLFDGMPGRPIRLVGFSYWVESAREVGAQVVSRWVDVEWSLAGTRLPLTRDTSDDRIDQLAEAVELFLLRLGSTGTVDSFPRPGVNSVLDGARPN